MADKIVGYVYQTYDYNKFKKLDGNRGVGSRRKEKLIQSITDGYIMNPSVVNEHMEIIDGQGRFEACQELGKPIHYIIVPGTDLRDCQRMNEYNSPWSLMDFVQSYCDEGNENYIRFLRAKEIVNLPISTILRLISYNAKGEKNLKLGTFTFTSKDIDTLMFRVNMGYEIAEALDFTSRKPTAYWDCIRVISKWDGYDHQRMLKNCKLKRNSFFCPAKLEDALKEFSKVYNHNFHAKNKVFFEDYMRDKGWNVRDYTEGNSGFEKTKLEKDISTLQSRRNK